MQDIAYKLPDSGQPLWFGVEPGFRMRLQCWSGATLEPVLRLVGREPDELTRHRAVLEPDETPGWIATWERPSQDELDRVRALVGRLPAEGMITG